MGEKGRERGLPARTCLDSSMLPSGFTKCSVPDSSQTAVQMPSLSQATLVTGESKSTAASTDTSSRPESPSQEPNNRVAPCAKAICLLLMAYPSGPPAEGDGLSSTK